MKILTDSNIFIKYWKTNDQNIKNTMNTEDIAICGVVRAELLHGARSERESEGIELILDAFDELEMAEDDWKQVGANLRKLRMSGINLPFPDAVIATIGLKYDVPVWTNDQHFTHMKTILTDLKLYKSEDSPAKSGASIQG